MAFSSGCVGTICLITAVRVVILMCSWRHAYDLPLVIILSAALNLNLSDAHEGISIKTLLGIF